MKTFLNHSNWSIYHHLLVVFKYICCCALTFNVSCIMSCFSAHHGCKECWSEGYHSLSVSSTYPCHCSFFHDCIWNGQNFRVVTMYSTLIQYFLSVWHSPYHYLLRLTSTSCSGTSSSAASPAQPWLTTGSWFFSTSSSHPLHPSCSALWTGRFRPACSSTCLNSIKGASMLGWVLTHRLFD